MNNLTFGDATFGYYETIAGGAGAGPTWHGRSGVHTHMYAEEPVACLKTNTLKLVDGCLNWMRNLVRTNTRITDPEILERRYPVLLHRFELRQLSGGAGTFNGGDGVVRSLVHRRTCSFTHALTATECDLALYSLIADP